MNSKMGCHDCPFWQILREFDSTQAMPPVVVGRCRAAAPRTTPGGLTVWPETRGEDWCGSHPHLAAWAQRLTEGAYLAQRGEK